MDLFINGQPKTYPSFQHIGELHAHLGLPNYGVAVELNGQVISKNFMTKRP